MASASDALLGWRVERPLAPAVRWHPVWDVPRMPRKLPVSEPTQNLAAPPPPLPHGHAGFGGRSGGYSGPPVGMGGIHPNGPPMGGPPDIFMMGGGFEMLGKGGKGGKGVVMGFKGHKGAGKPVAGRGGKGGMVGMCGMGGMGSAGGMGGMGGSPGPAGPPVIGLGKGFDAGKGRGRGQRRGGRSRKGDHGDLPDPSGGGGQAAPP
eukprot:scaffold191276_cov31-Tisochrysis_lutea.AAC.2